MRTTLYQAIGERADALAAELFENLHGADTPHYRLAPADVLRRRCRALVDAFVRACEGDTEALAVHVRGVTRERIAEGYYLAEIQRALNLLEASAWHAVVERSSVLDLLHHLSLITTVIGRAKDELAREFLEDARQARETLRRLAGGTDAYVDVDEIGALAGRHGP
jgi:hypothetical protein